jgi:hypothetical protein
MKLRDLNESTMLFEIRHSIANILSESINEYLSQIVALLKNSKQEELFDKENPKIDLEQLASMITGLKVLSNPDYRKAMTDEDIGFNPSSAKDFFHMLDSIPKDGKNIPKLTDRAFVALKSLAPSLYQKEYDAAQELKDGDEEQVKAGIKRLDTLSNKVSQMFNLLKSKAQSKSSTNSTAAAAATDNSLSASSIK